MQQLGSKPETHGERDAVHVAIIACAAGEDINPGQPVVVKDGTCLLSKNLGGAIGVADPFLKHPVREGSLVWVCLYPNTITGMRHHWYHPAFPGHPGSPKSGDEARAEAKQVIEHAAQFCGISYERMMDACESVCEYKDYVFDNTERYKNYDFGDKFWAAYKTLTGKEPPKYGGAPFTCSC